jgi:hypothetical protein
MKYQIFPLVVMSCAFLWLGSSCFAQEQTLVELADGSKIKGEVVSWDGESLSLKSTIGTIVLKKSQLTEKTIASLKESAGSSPADLAGLSKEELIKKIEELEDIIASLRKDSAALRAQVASGGAPPASRPGSKVSSGAQPTAAASVGAETQTYWISASGKRHNANCRYYETGKGREGAADEGSPCKVCGG